VIRSAPAPWAELNIRPPSGEKARPLAGSPQCRPIPAVPVNVGCSSCVRDRAGIGAWLLQDFIVISASWQA
jgi:hypothetical protein